MADSILKINEQIYCKPINLVSVQRSTLWVQPVAAGFSLRDKQKSFLILTLLVACIALSSSNANALGSWTTTGSMITGRYQHSSTCLLDGRILIAGGQNRGVDLASAEIYNPLTKTWNEVNNAPTALVHHTATLLPSGEVLFAGGIASTFSPISVFIFNPADGMWTTTGNLITRRYRHTATLLPDGRVLVAGGYGTNGPLSSCEIYDPSLGVWTSTGSMLTLRQGHKAVLLASGGVLVVGGASPSASPIQAEVYNPQTGIWTATGNTIYRRINHEAILLQTGEVLVSGGYDGQSALATCELYNPASGSWSLTGSMAVARQQHAMVLLPSGVALISGGDAGAEPFSSAEIYDVSSRRWIVTGSMSAARLRHTSNLLSNGKVLNAGGFSRVGGYQATAEIFDPAGVNTPVGTNINVSQIFNDQKFTVTVKFQTVTSPGNTTINLLSSLPPLGTDFQLTNAELCPNSNNILFAIETDALFDLAQIVVNFSDNQCLASLTTPQKKSLDLLHFDGVLPEPDTVTQSINPGQNTITSIALSSLSPFIVAEHALGADIDVNPNNINVTGEGLFTVYLRKINGSATPSDINVNTIQLATIKPTRISIEDGILVMKFRRRDFSSFLTNQNVLLVLKGRTREGVLIIGSALVNFFTLR